MISDFIRCLLACALLMFGGMGFVLFTGAVHRWRPAALFGLSWNSGLVLLYLTGNILTRSNPFQGKWALWIGGLCLASGLAAAGLSKLRPKWETEEKQPSGRTAHILICLCLAFIFLKGVLVLSLLCRMPVIDSDAANLERWVGLAKELAFRGLAPEALSGSYERFSPSLLPAFIAGYLSRWRDNLVCIPWFFTWMSILALAWSTIRTLTRNALLAAGVALLFASVPLSIVHIVRPGFSDLLLAGFLVSAVSVFLLTMYHRREFTVRSCLLLLFFLLGAALTKKEGIIWVVWLMVTALCFGLNQRWRISWRHILTVLFLAGGTVVLSYVFLHNWIRMSLISDSRVKWLFEFNYSDRATWMFFKTLMASNGFGLLYWIFFGLSAGLLLRTRDVSRRVLVVFNLLPFVFLFYFCCFTGNVEITERGTNIGRLLLPLQAFALPVFPLAWELYKEAGKNLHVPAPAPRKRKQPANRSRG